MYTTDQAMMDDRQQQQHWQQRQQQRVSPLSPSLFPSSFLLLLLPLALPTRNGQAEAVRVFCEAMNADERASQWQQEPKQEPAQ